MSKSREINKESALKLRNELDSVAPKFQAELNQILGQNGCEIFAQIKQVGPAEICIETLGDTKYKGFWVWRKVDTRETSPRLKNAWLQIRALEEKTQVELYSIIGPFGAEIKLRWNDKKEINKIWTPSNQLVSPLTK